MTTSVNSAFEAHYIKHARLALQREAGEAPPASPKHPSELKSVPLFLSAQNLVHPSEPPISALLYGGFLEHLGRCIYGGIVDDYRNPSPAQLLIKQDDGTAHAKGRLGWRKDVKEILASDGELEVPMMRWPGGNFVSNYHWQDGIGPIADRPKTIELAWLSDDPNIFGTDEYVEYCQGLGAEPYICLNMGSGTLEEALAWVEYCNGTSNSKYAKLRKQNTGREEPHNVKYWGLGNENYGPWQVGNMSATEYTMKAKSWAHALRLVDPTIKLVSCGHNGATAWDREVLATMVGYVDLHSIHFYSMVYHERSPPGFLYEKNVFGPAIVELYIDVCQSLIHLANNERALLDIPPREVKIAFDEWNVWDKAKGNADNGLEQWYDFTDMLGFVGWLNVFVRKHKEVGLANLAQAVNVIAPLMTTKDGVVRQTTFYPLKLFSKYMKNGRLMATPAQPDTYIGPTFPVTIQTLKLQPAYIDLVAIVVDTTDGISIRVSVLNRHPTADWKADFRLDAFDLDHVEIHEMYSDDLEAVNTFNSPDTVVPAVSKVEGEDWKGTHTVRKHSWSFFLFNGKSTS